jgi:hypothetical protein
MAGLSSFPRRIAALVHSANLLGAILVTGLFLSAFIANDALVMLLVVADLVVARILTTGGRPRLGCFPQFLLAFLDQQLIAKHLPDDLFGLGFGSRLKFAHGCLLPLKTGSGRNVSLVSRETQQLFTGCGSFRSVPGLEAGFVQCNTPVAEQN